MDEVTLRNFRCFRSEQTARLAPLTMLVGENSTGKTSFLAMIRALWDAAYRHEVPDFKEDPYDLGSFDEIAHHRGARGSKADTFEAGFATTASKKSARGIGVAGVGPYRFEVTFGKKGTSPVPVRRRFADGGYWIEEQYSEGKSWQIRFGTPRGAWQRRELASHDNTPIEPDDYVVIKPPLNSLMSLYSLDENSLRSEFVALNGSPPLTQAELQDLSGFAYDSPIGGRTLFGGQRPFASAPVRSKPSRTYDPSRPVPDPEGAYVPMYLASVYFENKGNWKDLKLGLESFGRAAGLFDEISIKPLGKRDSEPFQVQVRKFGARLKGPGRNLIDVGYGVSQVLPVVTELLRRRASPIFLLQQPEVHLHPSAQAALGTLFCHTASPHRQLVVETHSDHLLDRVRMEVRDGETNLKSKDVAILFFERTDLDVQIHSISLDEEGNARGAPSGYRKFFMEETQRSLGL